jgi:hypothetical protein
MSQAQEKYFADALAEKHVGVVNDGRTGQPDIIIESLGKELECKLTSRHKGGAISFQSDYESLVQKGELDYLYVIADENFGEFAVLHFCGLTIEDFRPLANGSRGKVAMYKHKGMKKCQVLVGSAINKNLEYIKGYQQKLKNPRIRPATRKKYEEKIRSWKKKDVSYSFSLERVNEN